MKKLDQIELKARDILEQTIGDINFIEPPIDLAKILEHFQLKLSIASFKDQNVAGAFDKDQKMIYLAKNEPPKRQLFTVAHEIGHVVLDHKKTQDVFYRHQASSFNGADLEEEKEANFFAASLLIPKELVKRFWSIHKDIELIAAYFGVSRSAAFWRLKNLRLI
ncbi:ImmA/IrrE family metallo-endopeptidase [Candidatus Daviesbacteria bacterium]|nr:ImmA/IrrE family metallo-endopeptidase [Candidatus Daviesbacteria bacterium]